MCGTIIFRLYQRFHDDSRSIKVNLTTKLATAEILIKERNQSAKENPLDLHDTGAFYSSRTHCQWKIRDTRLKPYYILFVRFNATVFEEHELVEITLR